MLPAIALFALTYILMLTFSKYRPYIALGSAFIFIVTGMLWQLTGRMIARSSGESGGSSGRQTGPNKQALRRIRRDYGKHLTLEDLAEEAGMTPRYFCRVFRDMTGRTPVDYLNYYRTECAAELLCDTDESVLEISMTCGFADPAYFSRVFRRYKGISATAYRKSSRQAGKESL